MEINDRNLSTLENLSFRELSKALWNGIQLPVPTNGDLIQQFRGRMIKWAEENKMPVELALTHPFLVKNALDWAAYKIKGNSCLSEGESTGHVAEPPIAAPKDVASAPVRSVDTSGVSRNRRSVARVRGSSVRAFERERPQEGGHILLTDINPIQRIVSFITPLVFGSAATNTGLINRKLLGDITGLSGHLGLEGVIDFTGPTDGIETGSDITGLGGSTGGLSVNADGHGINTSAFGNIEEIKRLKAPGTALYIEGIEFLRNGENSEGMRLVAEGKKQWESVRSQVEKLQAHVSNCVISLPNPTEAWLEQLRQHRIHLGQCPWQVEDVGEGGLKLKSLLPQALTYTDAKELFRNFFYQLAEEEADRQMKEAVHVMSLEELRNLRVTLLHSYKKVGVKKLMKKHPGRLTFTEKTIEVFYPHLPVVDISEAQLRTHAPLPPPVTEDEKGRVFFDGELLFDPDEEIPSLIPSGMIVSHVVEENEDGFVFGIRDVECDVRQHMTYGAPKVPAKEAPAEKVEETAIAEKKEKPSTTTPKGFLSRWVDKLDNHPTLGRRV